MKVNEVANLVGISVRTLHHYDEIGLLKPNSTTESGYRIYSDDDLTILQQILFFKELGFPLRKIKEIISSPSFDRREALELHRKMLLEKRSRLDHMITTVEKTMRHLKGELKMTIKEQFEGFDFRHNPYEQEARQRWGDQAVDDANDKLKNMSKEEQATLTDGMNRIYKRLATLRNESPSSAEAQVAIQEWFDFLNRMGSYSFEAFKGLGQMYVDDERFTKNIDRFGDGLAQFMCDAMAVFADTKQ